MHQTKPFICTLLCALALMIPCLLRAAKPIVNQTISYSLDRTSDFDVSLKLSLAPNVGIFKDSIKAVVSNPSSGTISIKSITAPLYEWYDNKSRQTHSMLQENVTIEAHCSNILPEEPFEITVLFMQGDSATPLQVVFKSVEAEKRSPLDEQKLNIEEKTSLDATFVVNEPKVPSTENHQKESIMTKHTKSLWERVSDRVISADSLMVQLLLVFILGVVVSFTPCIYPMIPITIGVVQSGGNGSFLSLCARTLSYTTGIATTFAALGLLAASTGPIYGKLLVNPWFVGILIALLLYMALSMIGLYELKMPQFASNSSDGEKKSLFSVFLFGAASGTIASPCVSPGLALLLSVVASIGNKFIGFLLLFVFGIGLSAPLLVAGIFSSSLSLLPRAGMWMLHVKRMFGFIMIATCFYYLQPFLSVLMFGRVYALYITLLGVYYAYEAVFGKLAGAWRGLNALIACACIAGAATIITHSVVQHNMNQEIIHTTFWHTNYESAQQQAAREKKLIFVDFWAQYCSLCKNINNTLLADAIVQNSIKKYALPVSLDCTNENAEPIKTILSKFSVKGYPAFLLLEPTTETVIGRWGGELYGMASSQFIEEFSAATQGHVDHSAVAE